MKITKVESWLEDVELLRPYSIAYETFSAVQLVYTRIETADGVRRRGRQRGAWLQHPGG